MDRIKTAKAAAKRRAQLHDAVGQLGERYLDLQALHDKGATRGHVLPVEALQSIRDAMANILANLTPAQRECLAELAEDARKREAKFSAARIIPALGAVQEIASAKSILSRRQGDGLLP